MAENSNDTLKESELGILVASTLHKLESISDHHVNERRKHFRITNLVVFVVSGLLLIIGVINMFYLYNFYQDTIRIINTTHELDQTVTIIGGNMLQINKTMYNFNTHMNSMQGIYQDVTTISSIMPTMQANVSNMNYSLNDMNRIMSFVNKDIQLVSFHLKGITYNVSSMGVDIYQIARPMGMFNRIIP